MRRLLYFERKSHTYNWVNFVVADATVGAKAMRIYNTDSLCMHYGDVIMGTMASQITSLTIVYSTVYSVQIKENIKAPRHWPLCGEFTGDRWIPRTNGQWRGKCFHLMTSSWFYWSLRRSTGCSSNEGILFPNLGSQTVSHVPITAQIFWTWAIPSPSCCQLYHRHGHSKPPWAIPTPHICPAFMFVTRTISLNVF